MSEYFITINESPTFYDLLEIHGHRLIIVNYFAEWCPPSIALSTTLKQVSEEQDGKVVVLNIDIDECDDLATVNEVDVIPAFDVMKSNFKVETVLGNQSEQKVQEIINKYS